MSVGPPTLTHLLAREHPRNGGKGRYPVELFGRSRFPRIGELPYLLTLAPRGFYWFQLVQEGEEAL
jgi:hypothetical protein